MDQRREERKRRRYQESKEGTGVTSITPPFSVQIQNSLQFLLPKRAMHEFIS
jgi:hypothetical protein